MADETSDNFAYFSSEYSQAVQALKAIQDKASTLMILGGAEDLRKFVDQFIEMAGNVKKAADDKNESNFSEWFRELIEKAETIRGAIAQS